MSMTFTKLFSSITESTIWTEPDHVRIVWITMLAMADSKGRVWGSIPGLANRARVTIEQVEDALERFKSPDKYSRTQEFEGRRIEDIDGGWKLINHGKYRAIRDEEAIKESKRKHINTKRAIERVDIGVDSGTPANGVDRSRANAEAEAEAEAEKTPKPPRGLEDYSTPFISFWNHYPRKEAKPAAWKSWKAQKLDEQEHKIIAHLTIRWPDPARLDKKYVPMPATFLNQRRWEDEIPTTPNGTAPAKQIRPYTADDASPYPEGYAPPAR